MNLRQVIHSQPAILWCATALKGRKVSSMAVYRDHLKGKALEIGGPSLLFGDGSGLPIYRNFATVDNCLFSPRTLWTGDAPDSFRYHPKRKPGRQFFVDATNLHGVPTAGYDSLLASHCLEHVANPLKALDEFKRVLKPDGKMLLILPSHNHMFDHRRPVTALSHMIEDYSSNVSEDDLTHLPEIIELHDLAKDKAAGTPEQFEKRCRENLTHRAMHHHTFTMESAAALLEHAGFRIIHREFFKPYNLTFIGLNNSYQAES